MPLLKRLKQIHELVLIPCIGILFLLYFYSIAHVFQNSLSLSLSLSRSLSFSERNIIDKKDEKYPQRLHKLI
jgi:hypothetical protein